MRQGTARALRAMSLWYFRRASAAARLKGVAVTATAEDGGRSWEATCRYAVASGDPVRPLILEGVRPEVAVREVIAAGGGVAPPQLAWDSGPHLTVVRPVPGREDWPDVTVRVRLGGSAPAGSEPIRLPGDLPVPTSPWSDGGGPLPRVEVTGIGTGATTPGWIGSAPRKAGETAFPRSCLRILLAANGGWDQLSPRFTVLGQDGAAPPPTALAATVKALETGLSAMEEGLGHEVNVRIALRVVPNVRDALSLAPVLDVPVRTLEGAARSPHLMLDLYRRLAGVWWPGAIEFSGPGATELGTGLRVALTLYLLASVGLEDVAREHEEVLGRSILAQQGEGFIGRLHRRRRIASARRSLSLGRILHERLHGSGTYRSAVGALMQGWWGNRLEVQSALRQLDLPPLGIQAR